VIKRAAIVSVLAMLAAAWYAALPAPARAPVPAPAELSAPVRGAIHIHSTQSDGTGTVEEIAAAAARAGLRFIVLTDHGDGTREPAAPRYRDGVLCIDAVEISADGGHVVALGLPRAPYPLGGEARDVLEDVARLGGFSIAAHPGSRKPELRWADWDLPFDGLEWLNGDSEWRDESPWSLLRVLFTYPARRPEALATLLDRPDDLMARWDVLAHRRRVVAVAAADAHARIGVGDLGEPYEKTASLNAPSYEAVFRTFSVALPHVVLTGHADADGRAVVDAIRGGRVYSVVDAVGGAAAMSFTATSGEGRAVAGDDLDVAGPVTLRVDVQAPPEARIDLLRDGRRVASGSGASLQHVGSEAAVYRVEVSLPGSPGQPPVPWIVSNPIYVGLDRQASPSHPRPPAVAFAAQYDNGPATGWAVEASDAARGAVDMVPAVGGTQLTFRYALGGTAAASPFAALVMPAGPALRDHDRLMFTARADRPMRLSVQLRAPSREAGERWHRAVFLDSTPREITIYFDDLRPRGATNTPRPVLADVESVLFVVDTVNTALGASGQMWLDAVRYGR
jgi:hypothetical protein